MTDIQKIQFESLQHCIPHDLDELEKYIERFDFPPNALISCSLIVVILRLIKEIKDLKNSKKGLKKRNNE